MDSECKIWKSFPLTATEQCMLQILGEQEVDNADLIKAWNKNAGETTPTTASSVPATPQLEIRRSDSLPAPKGPATQRPEPSISEERSPRKRTRSPASLRKQIQEAGVFVRQSEEIIKRMRELHPERSLLDPLKIKGTEK